MGAKYQRPTTPAERARRDQAAADKLTALHERLTEQVAALRTGQDWRAWLDVAGRFHTYSFNNTLLIYAQNPEATAVAGYGAWKALGRQVDKGERGIQILAPVIRRTHRDDQTSGTGEKSVGRAAAERARSTPPAPAPPDEDAAAVGERRVAGYRVTYVWDVTQTSGDPLPTRPLPQLLAGQAPPGLWDALATVVTDRGFTLQRGHCTPANGWTNFTTHTVRVRDDVDDAQAVKTLAHELGHVLLHHPTAADHASTASCRGRGEVEAESVAYLVAAEHGLATDDYTFAYVAGWAADVDHARPEDVVRDTGTRVLTAARTLLAVTNPEPKVDADLAAQVQAGVQRAATAREHAEAAATLTTTPEPPIAATAADPNRLRQLHTDATAFYTARLADTDDTAARRAAAAVLRQRGVTPEQVTGYQVGYAPPGWTRLVDHLHANGYTDAELLEAGVAMATSRGSVVDRFRDRIMFPVHDPDGQVIAFIGRALEPGGDTPKYLNSPETPLYRKSEILYGLGAEPTRQALTAGATPVIVEGPFDAIAVTAAGAGAYAGIAPSGTALTPGQVAALNTAVVGALDTRTLVIAFDGDQAGQEASLRAWQPLRAVGAWPTTPSLPPGLDPAGLAQHHGSTALRAALDEATPLADLVVDRHVDQWDGQLRWVEGRLGAARAAAPVIARLLAEHMPRQIDRLVERLDLCAETVSTLIAEAVARGGSDASERLQSRNRRNDLDRGRSVSTSSKPSRLARVGYPILLRKDSAADTAVDQGQPRNVGAAQRPASSKRVGLW
jgi:DNA primase